MAEKVGVGWKWLAGVLLVLCIIQTLALGAILAEMKNISYQIRTSQPVYEEY